MDVSKRFVLCESLFLEKNMATLPQEKVQCSAIEKAYEYIELHKDNEKYNLQTATAAFSYAQQRSIFLDALHGGNDGYIFLPRKKYWKHSEDQYYIDRVTGKKRRKAGMQNDVTFKLGSGDPDALIWADTNDSYVSANVFDGGVNDRGMMLRTEHHCAGINELHFDIDILHGDFEVYPHELADQVMEHLIPELLQELPQPTMIVFSGRGLTWIYRYIELIEDPTVEEIAGKRKVVKHFNEAVLRHDAAYRRIVERLHAAYDPELIDFDTKITDHARICRIPGTINRKAKRYAKLIYCNPDLRYDPEELYKLFGVSADPIQPVKLEKKHSVKKPASGQAISDTKIKKKAIPGNAIPFAPVEYRTAAKSRIPRMQQIPDEVTLIDGSGRHKFIFVFYCHCRLLYLQPIAADMARDLNARFAEPLSDVELENQLERVDIHYETDYNLHGDGCYIFKTDTFVTFLPMDQKKAREMGFFKSKDMRERCKAHQAEAEDRDREIAELWLAECTAQEISDALQDRYRCTSIATVKRVIKRLGLDRERWQRMCDVDFEKNRRYARKVSEDVKEKQPAEIIKFADKKEDAIYNDDESINFSIIKYDGCLCDEGRVGMDEQESAYRQLLTGQNCFVMGAAGTGKSTLIKRFVDEKEASEQKVLVLAPSGSAASNIHGVTIHKGLGIPVKDRYDSVPLWDIAKLWRLYDVDVIVMDEVGMVRADQFDYVMDMITSAEDMFEKHIQVVCVGDFRQLAPVHSSGMDYGCESWGSLYAFSSPMGRVAQIWQNVIVLKHVWRQDNLEFCAALQAVSNGDMIGAEYINSHAQIGINQDELIDRLEVGEVYLAAYRSVIDATNRMMIARHKEDVSYREWECSEWQNGMSELFPVSRVISTFVGMPVVFVQNDGERFSNGTRGVIKKVYKSYVQVSVGDRDMKIYPQKIYALDGSDRVIKQLPFLPAYAMTIHKSQGLTLDKVILDPNCFEVGQLYTALSRVRDIQDLVLTRKIKKSDLRVSEDVKMFLANIG